MYYDTNVYWNKGTVRDVNQDSLVLLQALTIRGRVLMAAVCDGMGGLEMGEMASGYLTEELVTWFYDDLLAAIGKKKPLWAIRHCAERKIYQVQSRIQRYAAGRRIRMGTTLSLLILWEKRYMLWHLGDSRIYRFHRNGKARILTSDHVCGVNALTKCVGSFGFFMPDYKMGSVRGEEAFLVCSDGFWRRIEKEEMEKVFIAGQMTGERGRKRLCEIGEAAMRRGETDNLSAVYIKVTRKREDE
ncbi:MAG: serine/threonine-protein phosphatase [Bacillus sp. (in: Bacteria)]|nr:serine/threonine-protein phosphatase [Bacillus sp. (in: firmicutes)]MCM1425947.1 serine/threonine-protein phosphatase [Eubacterium sp.]